MNLEGRSIVENPALLPVDKWIYSRLNSAARDITEAFLSYRFNDASQKAYEFFWNDFCDWYVEATKLSMKSGGTASDDAEKDRATTVLLDVLSQSLRLLHPLLPFVTEEIYGKISHKAHKGTKDLLITSEYPRYREELRDDEAEEKFSFLQDLVRKIRTLRSECTITPDKKIRVTVSTSVEKAAFLSDNAELVKLLAGLSDLAVSSSVKSVDNKTGAIVLAGTDWEAQAAIAEAVDLKALAEKFRKNLDRDKKYIAGLEARLANADFVKNAPQELVEAEKIKLAEAKERTGIIDAYLKNLG
jgi:valyl-tRNA synthetase